MKVSKYNPKKKYQFTPRVGVWGMLCIATLAILILVLFGIPISPWLILAPLGIPILAFVSIPFVLLLALVALILFAFVLLILCAIPFLILALVLGIQEKLEDVGIAD